MATAVLDIDGTLLSPRGEVTPRAKAAVQGCLRAGLLVCFATGRNWTESQIVLDARFAARQLVRDGCVRVAIINPAS